VGKQFLLVVLTPIIAVLPVVAGKKERKKQEEFLNQIFNR
jgi:hypothetical protein